ncbi:putative cytosolic oligopeptidase A [Nymphon striatum]|nr:putative cytosolic oligopeptidase A [Nymphon striatum]
MLFKNTVQGSSERAIRAITLLPEIPRDTPETNPLLRHDELPHFSNVTPVNYYNGLAKTFLEFEVSLKKLEEKMEEPGFVKNFENIIVPIEEALHPLDSLWASLKLKILVKHTEPEGKIYWKLLDRIAMARNERFGSNIIYQAFKDLEANRDQFTVPQQKIIDLYLSQARLLGMNKSVREVDHLKLMSSKILRTCHVFASKVDEANNKYYHQISDTMVVRDFPPDLLCALAVDKLNPTRGPWKISLYENLYKKFMEHCPSRRLRYTAWEARNKRCGLGDTLHNNSDHFEEIRNEREKLSQLLDYKNYLDMIIQTRMTTDVDTVKSMLASLKLATKPFMDKEVEALKKFAEANDFNETMELWDVDFWRRRQKLSLYNLDEDEVRAYFPFEKVLCGLFELCNNLFGVKMEDCTHEVDKWHESVRFFKVYKNGEHKASFYFDIYARPHEKRRDSWVDVAKCRCDSLGVKPVLYVVTNFCPPVGNQQSLLSFSEVRTLFMKLGKALQYMLTEIPYMEATSTVSVEWDAANVSEYFMANWLDNYSIIKLISSHYENQVPMPEELFNKCLKERSHMNAYDLMQELYLCDYDMNLYSNNKQSWSQHMATLWPMYNPFKLHKVDCHPCSLTLIVSDSHPSAYFSFLWSKMIAADLFEAFTEIDFNDQEEMRKKGKLFQDTHLALMGGYPAGEIFRMFRKRDPSPEALHKKIRFCRRRINSRRKLINFY